MSCRRAPPRIGAQTDARAREAVISEDVNGYDLGDEEIVSVPENTPGAGPEGGEDSGRGDAGGEGGERR